MNLATLDYSVGTAKTIVILRPSDKDGEGSQP